MIIKSVLCWCKVRETTKREIINFLKQQSGGRKDERKEGRKEERKAQLLFYVYTVPAVLRESLST